eukprot:SAG22_NODE_709_length_7742_cov_2.383488_6_plen_472_part_00
MGAWSDLNASPDLRHFLYSVDESPKHTIYMSGHHEKWRWAARGIYALEARLAESVTEEEPSETSFNPLSDEFILYEAPSLGCMGELFKPLVSCLHALSPRMGYQLPLMAELGNAWNEDFEPGFHYSNNVINRQSPMFIERKSNRTTALIKAFLEAIPDESPDKHYAYWEQPIDMQLNSSDLSTARAALARHNAGLNTVFTGPQLRSTMVSMGRTKRINKKKCKSVFAFLVCPFLKWRQMLWRGKPIDMKHKDIGAIPALMLWFRKTRGVSPERNIMMVIVGMWVSLVYVLVLRSFSKMGALHELEPTIALLYYIWAGLTCALDVADEVARLPSDTPFDLAFLKAEISTTKVSMTQIGNGQQIATTVQGFVQMVCRVHEAEDDDEEEEEDGGDDEESDPFKIGRNQLAQLWVQSAIKDSLPFAEQDATNASVIFDYETESHREVESPADWADENVVFMVRATCRSSSNDDFL